MSDPVNKPSHYQVLPGIEVIDVRRALLDKVPDGVSYYSIDCWSRAWEYLTRMWGKNGLEDARKAQIYLNWLIDDLENGHLRDNQGPTKIGPVDALTLAAGDPVKVRLEALKADLMSRLDNPDY